MQPIIEDIIQRFAKYPWAEYEYTDDSITYLPANDDGFRVRLVVLKRPQFTFYSVFFNGLHEEFVMDENALNQFRLGLSVHCQLHEFSRAGCPYRWLLERDGLAGWTSDWEIIQFSNPAAWKWWIKPQVRVLQNHLLDAGGGAAACAVAKR